MSRTKGKDPTMDDQFPFLLGLAVVALCSMAYTLAWPLHQAYYLRRYVGDTDSMRAAQRDREGPDFTQDFPALDWPDECRSQTREEWWNPAARLGAEWADVGLQERTWKQVSSALTARDASCVDAWNAFPEHAAIARTCREILSAEMGWPSDRFVPEDPVDVLLWEHGHHLVDYESESAVQAMELALGLTLSDDFWERSLQLTFGELVDRLVQEQGGKSGLRQYPPPTLREVNVKCA